MVVIQSASGYFEPTAQPFELYEEPEGTWTIASTLQMIETTDRIEFAGLGFIKAESL